MSLPTRDRCKAYTAAVRGGNRCQRDEHKGGLCYQHWMATYKIRKERVNKLTIKQQRDKLLEALREIVYSHGMSNIDHDRFSKLIALCEGK